MKPPPIPKNPDAAPEARAIAAVTRHILKSIGWRSTSNLFLGFNMNSPTKIMRMPNRKMRRSPSKAFPRLEPISAPITPSAEKTAPPDVPLQGMARKIRERTDRNSKCTRTDGDMGLAHPDNMQEQRCRKNGAAAEQSQHKADNTARTYCQKDRIAQLCLLQILSCTIIPTSMAMTKRTV